MRVPALLIAACLAAAGCGGDDESSAPAPGSPPRPGVGATLDENGLDTVHDALYACLRKAGGRVLAYADALAAPAAESALLDAGDARFIGVRDAAQHGRGDVDVLIFPAADRAEEALPALQQEAASAERDGIFVRVAKAPGGGAAGRRADRALKRCFDETRPGG